MEINIGPVSLRAYRGNGWWSTEGAFVTNRDSGLAMRESAVRVYAKSEHITDMIGTDNPDDVFTCPVSGELFFGKTGFSPLTAQQVYAATLIKRAKGVGNQGHPTGSHYLADA